MGKELDTFEELIRPRELTKILGLSKTRVYLMLRTGELPAIRVLSGQRRSSYRVLPSDLLAWIAGRKLTASSAGCTSKELSSRVEGASIEGARND